MSIEEVREQVNEGIGACRGSITHILSTVDALDDAIIHLRSVTNGATNQLAHDSIRDAEAAVDKLHTARAILAISIGRAKEYRRSL